MGYNIFIMKKADDRVQTSSNNTFVQKIGEKVSRIEELFDKIGTEHELEFIFGSTQKDQLNKEKYILFLKYMNQLKQIKKYDLEPEDTLDINFSIDQTTNYRITIQGYSNIKLYFNDLAKKQNNYVIFKMALFLMMKIKDKHIMSIIKKVRSKDDTVMIEEFDMKTKLSSEIEIFDDIVKKNSKIIDPLIVDILNNKQLEVDLINKISRSIMFRYKERMSMYYLKNEKEYLRLDLTHVKSSRILERINSEQSDYELELEFMSKVKPTQTIRQTIYNNIEQILKMSQMSNFIITVTESDQVLEYYKNLVVENKTEQIKSLAARQPISLEIQHAMKLADQYAVTDKADGERYFMIIYENNIYFISNNLKVKASGIKLSDKKSSYNGTVTDGELISVFISKSDGTRIQRYIYMIFDCLFVGGNDVRKEQKIMTRLEGIDEVIKECFVFEGQKGFNFKQVPTMSGSFDLNDVSKFYDSEIKRFYSLLSDDLSQALTLPLIRRKYFMGALGAVKWEIFKYSEVFWKLYAENSQLRIPYLLDGLIYHPLEQAYTLGQTKFHEYKWKPSSKNSIDFYITFKRDPLTNKSLPVYDNSNSENERNKPYKIAILHVGKTVDGREKPVPFLDNGGTPEAYLFLTDGEARDASGDIITDMTVVEFTYKHDPNIPFQQRWHPERIRYDKTEQVERYQRRYGNSELVAHKVMRSILNPIKISDMSELSRGKQQYEAKMAELTSKVTHEVIVESAKETQYYQRTLKLANSLRQWHNYIKSNLIYPYCLPDYIGGYHTKILDFGCGQGGDIMKFYTVFPSEYVGLDYDYANLHTPGEGAISRYNFQRKRKANFPPMTFIQADLRAKLIPADQQRALSGMTSENYQLLEKYFMNDRKQHQYFDRINCQFAIHYFLESKLTWENFKFNINDNLVPGGYFLVTCMDGKLIRNLLKGLDYSIEYFTDQNGNKKIFYQINKKFNDSEKPGPGLQIDFHGAWMFAEGVFFPEYIVDEEFIVPDLLEGCDLELVESELFENIYELQRDYVTKYASFNSKEDTREYMKDVSTIYTDKTELGLICKKFSFLNRYYIFRKKEKSRMKASLNTNQVGGLSEEMNDEINFNDSKKFKIANLSENTKSSFITSIRDILATHSIIPESINTNDLCVDFNIFPVDDKILSDDHIANIISKISIDHETSKKSKIIERIIDGLNLFLVSYDCNGDIDVKYIRCKSSSKQERLSHFIILKKDYETMTFNPIYEKNGTKITGIFTKHDKIVKYLSKFI